jgi:hypothetical protein
LDSLLLALQFSVFTLLLFNYPKAQQLRSAAAHIHLPAVLPHRQTQQLLAMQLLL